MKISKEFKIGIFAVVVLAATFVVINILRGTDVFNRNYDIVGHFDNVEGLVASAPVQIRGFAAGRVSSVRYDKEGNDFIVTCSVSNDFDIPRDSRMMLYSTSIMGGKGIRIDLGSDQQAVKDGDSIQTGSEADLMAMLSSGISPILNSVTAITDSLQRTISSVNSILDPKNRASIEKSLEHLEATLADAEHFADNIDSHSADIDKIMSEVKALSGKLAPIADGVQKSLDDVNKITADLAKTELNQSIAGVDEAVENINSTLKKVQDPLSTLITDLDGFVKEVKENPKKYIKISVF